jgi:hypothetical protein
LISSCRRGITPHGSCRITELMAPLLICRFAIMGYTVFA